MCPIIHPMKGHPQIFYSLKNPYKATTVQFMVLGFVNVRIVFKGHQGQHIQKKIEHMQPSAGRTKTMRMLTSRYVQDHVQNSSFDLATHACMVLNTICLILPIKNDFKTFLSSQFDGRNITQFFKICKESQQKSLGSNYNFRFDCGGQFAKPD